MPSVTLHFASLGPEKYGERKLYDHYQLKLVGLQIKKFSVYKFVIDILLSEDLTSSHISSS